MAGPTIGVILCANASATSLPVKFPGTRSCFVVNATTYPTTMNFQVQGPSGAWININAVTISADGIYPYDIPAGLYRVFMSGGAPAGVYVNLVSVPY